MNTVPLTGGCGFIGSHLAEMYRAEGWAVVVVDNLSTGTRSNLPQGCTLYQKDVADPDLIDVFRKHRPTIVNHHAAQVDVRISVSDPLLDARTNILGLLNILQCCREFRPEHILFASSGGAIYGDDVPIPTPEEAAPQPLSPYGVAKYASELYLNCFQREYKVPFTALRYGNVYGPRQNPHGEAGVVAIFFHKLLAGETPTIHGEGQQSRDYVFVKDVVTANRLATQQRLEGAYNVGTGVPTTVNQLGTLILSALGHEGRDLPHGPAKAGEQMRSLLDSSKIRASLGKTFSWTPLQEGLILTCNAFRKSF